MGYPNTYCLYAAMACPFAHRTIMARALVDIKLPIKLANPWLGNPKGWLIEQENEAEDIPLWQVYKDSNPLYTGRVTVPVLWDRQENVIASAESDEITRAIFSTCQNTSEDRPLIQGPLLQTLLDWLNKRVNLGVYKIGFASSQADYV